MGEIMMTNKEIKTPKHWEGERYQPLVEAETVHGNKVMIPKRFMPYWKTANYVYELTKAQGGDHLDSLKQMKDMDPCFVTIVKVYFEVYERKN